MAHPGDHGPKRQERRYGSLETERRRFYYAFRRHLHYTPEQVDALPWWQVRMFLEGLNEEFRDPDEPETEVYDGDLADLGITMR